MTDRPTVAQLMNRIEARIVSQCASGRPSIPHSELASMFGSHPGDFVDALAELLYSNRIRIVTDTPERSFAPAK